MTGPAEERARAWRGRLLLALAALFAVHPLMVHGASDGHDFDFHLVNWMEAATQFLHGNLHPHWAFSPAFNAGEPRFIFYPPLSWTLGGLLGLLLTHLPLVSQAAGWNATPVLFTWIAFSLAGGTMYRLAREFASEEAALLAGVLYLANPYMLFTAYERTAYGELLAAAWIPLLLLAILRERVSITQIALPVALLWLTNVPAAVMGSYTLALIALVRIFAETWASRTTAAAQLALKAFAGAALGVALAAFYILPAAYERRFVQVAMATIAGMRIDQNFLFERTGTSADAVLHDQVLHSASTIAVLLLAGTFAFLIAALVRRRARSTPDDLLQTGQPAALPLLLLVILTAGIALMLTPMSAAIWSHAPEASFLQFPWRLLAILAPVFALAAAASLDGIGWTFNKTALAGMAVVALLTLPAYHLFRQTQYQEDMPAGMYAAFQANAGFEPTDEYTPVGANNDALDPYAQPYWLAGSAAAPSPRGRTGVAPLHVVVNAAATAQVLILNLRDYPRWRILMNGEVDSERKHRADGLIALTVPAGTSTIDVRYMRGWDEGMGDGITALAISMLFALVRRMRTQILR